MEKRTAKDIMQHYNMAKAVMKHHFKKFPRQLIYKPTGQTNFVYEAKMGREDFIVRISPDIACFDDFEKEKWVVSRVQREGVPVADILEIGVEIIAQPYMLQRKINGIEGINHPDRKRIIQQMAEYCSVINTIPTIGFGNIFDWCKDKSVPHLTLKEFMEKEMRATHLTNVLLENKILTLQQKEIFEENLDRLRNLKRKPALNHGDMRLKNVIVDEKANIVAILDWQDSISAIVPFWDLSIALHDLSIDNKQVFIEAYNITKKDFLKWGFAYKVLNILNYARAVENAVDAGNKQMLEEFRLRLQGAYDIFSFHN